MKVFNIVDNNTGEILAEVYGKISRYASNDHLAIQLFDCDDHSPYATLTVNISGTDIGDDMAYLDVNNFPDAEKFVRDNDLGFPMWEYAQSGFVSYPLYFFDLTQFE